MLSINDCIRVRASVVANEDVTSIAVLESAAVKFIVWPENKSVIVLLDRVTVTPSTVKLASAAVVCLVTQASL